MTRRHGLLALQAMVTVALLVFVFRSFDWAALAAIGGRVSASFYLVTFVALIVGHGLYAWRWQVVLAGMNLPVPYLNVLRQYLVGVFFSSVMPTAIGGDAAKVFYLGRHIGFMEAGASVLVDRFLGLLWLSVIGAGLSWVTGADTPLLLLNRNLLTVSAMVFVVMLTLIWTVPVDRLIPGVLRSGRLAGLVGKFEELAGHVRVGGCRPLTLAASGSVVLTYILLLALVYRIYFAATGLGAPGLLPTMNVLVSMSVFVNVPLSVGGIGLREQLHYLLFSELGVAKEASVSLSLLLFAYSLVLSVAGYIIWLRMKPAVAAERA